MASWISDDKQHKLKPFATQHGSFLWKKREKLSNRWRHIENSFRSEVRKENHVKTSDKNKNEMLAKCSKQSARHRQADRCSLEEKSNFSQILEKNYPSVYNVGQCLNWKIKKNIKR